MDSLKGNPMILEIGIALIGMFFISWFAVKMGRGTNKFVSWIVFHVKVVIAAALAFGARFALTAIGDLEGVSEFLFIFLSAYIGLAVGTVGKGKATVE